MKKSFAVSLLCVTWLTVLTLGVSLSFTACKRKQPSTGTADTTQSTTATTALLPFVSDSNAPRNALIIKTATTQSISLGLGLLTTAKQKSEVDLIAGKVNQVVSSSILPYLNGTSGATSAGVNGFVNGQFVDLPAEARTLISLAAMLLDQYLPAPSADSVMNPDQLLYVKAFFQGVVDGTSRFSSSARVVIPHQEGVKDVPYKPTGKWFNPKEES